MLVGKIHILKMLAKILEASHFLIIKVAIFEISNSESLRLSDSLIDTASQGQKIFAIT